MVIGVFHLADEDGDGQVTKHEMHNTMDMAESEEFAMEMAYMFNMTDTDQDGMVDYDELWATMDSFQAAGELSAEDAWAIESLLEWADVELGNHDSMFTLEEAQAGIAEIVGAVKYSATIDGLFEMVDSDGDDAIQFSEIEAVLPTVC